MTCEQIRDRLDSLSTSPLAADERRELDQHLLHCPQCRADHEASAAIADRLGGLRREIQPAEDLWTGIAPRLKRTRRRIDLPVWRVAAAALVLMAMSSTATWLLLRPSTSNAPDTFESFEADYAQAALELSELYTAARSSMSPATKAVVERNLAVIERALSESRDALRNDPTNPALEAIVAAAYRRKIAFLERATTLDRES